MKSLFFFGEPVPIGSRVVDQLGRAFILTARGYEYSGRPIPAVDIDWPVLLEENND